MIKIKNLNYHVKNKTILESINLIIEKGEFAVIVGPNGAGKSTLLKSILNQIPVQSGEIMINGLSHVDFLKKNQIGYLPQSEDFFPDFPMKVIELVLMGRYFFKKPFRSFTQRDYEVCDQSLKLVSADQLANHDISSLSGGEFQRVLLARALATESDYICLDEPEAGIDKIGIKSFYELLGDLHRQGKTIIAVSHDIETVGQYCSKVICLNRRIHTHNTPGMDCPVIIHDKNEET